MVVNQLHNDVAKLNFRKFPDICELPGMERMKQSKINALIPGMDSMTWINAKCVLFESWHSGCKVNEHLRISRS